MKHQAPTPQSRPHQQQVPLCRAKGFSLVEIMVSLAIGLVMISAVFANYLNNSAGVRQAAAMAQVTQDAALAMGILRNHIAMAGYSRPLSVSNTGVVSHYFPGADAGTWASLYGCPNGFDNATDNNAIYATINCNAAAAPQPDALAVSYEADNFSTPTSSGTPTDCLGSALAPSGTNPNTYYVADNRFAIIPATANTPPSLGCMGNGGVAWGAPLKSVAGSNFGYMPLVENIAHMRIWYGIGDPAPLGTNVTQYVRADAINTTVTGGWTRVLSVRICLIARSAAQVLNPPDPVKGQPYLDCDGGISYALDRRIYQRFITTIVLNNRT